MGWGSSISALNSTKFMSCSLKINNKHEVDDDRCFQMNVFVFTILVFFYMNFVEQLVCILKL